MPVVLDRLDSKEEVALARAAQRCIINALDHSHALSSALVDGRAERLVDTPLLRLPPRILRLIADMLGSLAQGKAVAVMPKELDVTTQEAAMFLNVSRPYLVRLLEEGRMPFHKVGTHRRVRFDDLVSYMEERRKVSDEALQQLVDQAQELGLGY
jgi:excisionase family DNA binding protein